jgi:DNA polymerase III subunit delta'
MINNFSNILCQDRAINILRGMIKRGRVHHALLFTGPDGVGKKATAMMFAKIFNCKNLTEDFEPCEICQSCKLFGTYFFTHSDFKIFSDIQNPLVIDRKFMMESVSLPTSNYSEYAESEKLYLDSIEILRSKNFLLDNTPLQEGIGMYDTFYRSRDMVFKGKSDSSPDGQFLMSNLEKLLEGSGEKIQTAFNVARRLYGFHFTTTFFKSIKTDLLREQFVDEINFKPYELDKKVFVIDEFEKISTNSENIILKTLEEPPENSILILITSKKQSLISTILSRCMELEFSPLPHDVIREFLVKHRGENETDASLLSTLSGGSLGRAITSNIEGIKDIQRKMLLILDYLRSKADITIEYCQKEIVPESLDLNEKRNQVKESLKILNQMVRDILLLKISPDSRKIINSNIKKDLFVNTDYFDEKKLLKIADLIDETITDIDMNVDIDIALESFLIKGKISI